MNLCRAPGTSLDSLRQIIIRGATFDRKMGSQDLTEEEREKVELASSIHIQAWINDDS